MSEEPTWVVLESWASGAPVPVAEFRREPGRGVTLTVVDPEWGAVARTWFDQGVPTASGRTVRRDAGAGFLRALLEPRQLGYYRLVDRTGQPPSAGNGTGRSPVPR